LGIAIGVTGNYFFYTRDLGRMSDRLDSMQQQIAPPAPAPDARPGEGKAKGKKGH